MQGRKLLGGLIALVGALIILRFFGISLGGIMGWFMPFILMGLGVLGWSNNRKVIGTVLVVIGAATLAAKLSWLIMLLMAVGMILLGAALFKNGRSGRGGTY